MRNTKEHIVTFGKFNGVPISKVPTNYLEWVLENFEHDHPFMAIARKEHDRRPVREQWRSYRLPKRERPDWKHPGTAPSDMDHLLGLSDYEDDYY